MGTDERPLVLVVDDREDIYRFCERQFGDAWAFRHAAGGRAAAEHLRRGAFAAVVLDRDFSRADPAELLGPPSEVRDEGLHILRWLRREHARLPVIMVTGVRDLPVALAAAELGADFLAWEDVTADPAALAGRLQQALAHRPAEREAMLAAFRARGVIVESPAFAAALLALARALPGRAPILLQGETGTGKDTLAYAIHDLGGDPSRTFANVNLAAINPRLVESELFGHTRGAFTGASRDSLGKLRFAHGGTLFLNEIGELAPEIQVKLLTVLERREVVPVGDVRAYPADFRLIAASQRPLDGLVEAGSFRRDLLHRLAWHVIDLPPLAARREDIPPLVRELLDRSSRLSGQPAPGITREALEYLQTMPWLGNVRELGGLVEAARARSRHTITIGDIHEVLRPVGPGRRPGAGPAAQGEAEPAPDRLAAEEIAFDGLDYDQLTRAYYYHLNRRTGGQMSEVARLAGIGRSTAYDWRRRYGGAGADG